MILACKQSYPVKISVLILLSFFILIPTVSFSCECPPLQTISKDLTKNYDVIFFGRVDSVSSCPAEGISTAYFTIRELYKGSVEQQVKVDFDCATACLMDFAKGDEWLMYVIYQRFDLMTVNICGHSRKYFSNPAQDTYQLLAGRTFEDEKHFLKTALGAQPFIQKNKLNQQQNELAPHNEQPTGIGKIWLLLISLAVMGIIFYVTRNKKKNGN